MFKKVLIANRGEIACRIARTLKLMGVHSVAIYSKADAMSRHLLEADSAFEIGPAAASESYLAVEKILSLAKREGVEAIHPGYGFLSENATFARRCAEEGIVFIGPQVKSMRDFGLKHEAKELARKAGVPLLPGSGLLDSAAEALKTAAQIGYPLMIKSTAGGGGIGMVLCEGEAELEKAFESVRRLAQNNFADGGIFLEKFVPRARHVEVQIFGDGKTVVALGDRDCSAQRRNQKVVEETPAPGLSESVRAAMTKAAIQLGNSVAYESAGTVEFIYDPTSADFYFLEVNCRLQVEHGVTETVSGVDLVEWMVKQAAGEPLPLADYKHKPQGHSIQARVYAEDPARDFQPSSGLVTEATFPAGVRVDTWLETGVEVSPYYDPLLAKIIVHGKDRAEALTLLTRALEGTRIAGIETNLEYLRQLSRDDVIARGELYTRYLAGFPFEPKGIEVMVPGTQSTVQDYPGRVGYWDVGIPPSGPMDSLSLRLANRAVGNRADAAGLEMMVQGATLRFRECATVALAGADMQAELDGVAKTRYAPFVVEAGQILKLGRVQGPGARAYLAVRGGLQSPLYLGSRSTFTLGRFGGHGGRALLLGDVLEIVPDAALPADLEDPEFLAPSLHTPLTREWNLAVLYGPHGAPDFFTDKDISCLFQKEYEVHYNSARTGVRLIGPKPDWARTDGGEAGLHPSNIHDNAYAIGAVDFTGDMPILLGPDGPSLGGFVCPATVIKSDLWKLGQLSPGDKVRFTAVTPEQAAQVRKAQDEAIAAATALPSPKWEKGDLSGAVQGTTEETATQFRVTYRRSGEDNLLVEYGPLVLDLNLRFRAHALMEYIRAQKVEAVLDLTPGIRSLQVHFDSRRLSFDALLALVQTAEEKLGRADDLVLPSRIVHLPLSWDDPATQLAALKYQQLVRKDAPWCPDNIEFIRRINGLESRDDVKKIVFDASYMVLGLGDVYLGAPVATPVDPRHRLVTTKYNPARTWTPENAVGIGGAYLCIYGMEGPGGYQFVGRTLQVYNRFRVTQDFHPDKPWLLRFFDQIRFYPVSAEELLDLREAFAAGRHKLRVEESEFRLADYNQFLKTESSSIATFKKAQQKAFDAERQAWVDSGQINFEAENPEIGRADTAAIPPGAEAVASHIPGSVWKIEVEPGARVKKGDTLVILESMKMEISITAPEDGVVLDIRCQQGGAVSAGETLLTLKTEKA